MKNRIKRWLAILAASTLLAGGATLAVAAPASAHTGHVTGIAECEDDGTYTVTWRYDATNVSHGVEAETKAMTTNIGTLKPIDGVDKGGQIFLSVWSEHQVNVPGARVMTGNWTGYFKTVGIPGSTTGKVTTMVQTDWKHGPSEDPVGEVELPGDCGPYTPPVPEKPLPIYGSEHRTNDAICVTPLDGRTEVTTEERGWTQDWTLDVAANKWVISEKVYTDWMLIDTQYGESEDCVPPTPEDLKIAKEWSAPVFDCKAKVGDEISITRTVFEVPQVWNQKTRKFESDWENRETTTETGIYVVTEADIEGLDCPVVTPPTEPEPTPTPTPTPEPTEPPVTPTPEPTPSVTPTPVPSTTPTPPVVSEDPPADAPETDRLARTGGSGPAPFVVGGLALLLAGGLILGLRRLKA